MTKTHRHPPIILDDILPVVLDEYGVNIERFYGSGRHPNVVRSREAFAWLARKLTVMSYPEMAAYCGRVTSKGVPSHTAIIHQHRRAEAAYASDEATRKGFDQMVKKVLKGGAA